MRDKRFPDWDWRIWGSSVLTVLWLGAGTVYLATVVGWAFWQGEADDIGGFFEGFFAPLAFLWLVVGLFIQQKELARTRDEMQRANALSAQQATAIEASATTARQQAFFLIAENVRRQTANLIGAMLAAGDHNLVDKEDLELHWSAHAAGDHESFPRLLLNLESGLREGTFGSVRAGAEFFFGTPFRASLSDEYIRSFRRLLRLARECDTSDAIRGTVTHTPHGIVYGAMLSELRAPVAWLFLDGPVPDGSDVDVSGTWRMVLDPDNRDVPTTPEFTLRLWDGGDGWQGTTASGLGETPVEAAAVAGNALFFRLDVGDDPVPFCATVDGDRMRGRAESQFGDVYAFTATRRDGP